jgi:hypothetical protein
MAAMIEVESVKVNAELIANMTEITASDTQVEFKLEGGEKLTLVIHEPIEQLQKKVSEALGRELPIH